MKFRFIALMGALGALAASASFAVAQVSDPEEPPDQRIYVSTPEDCPEATAAIESAGLTVDNFMTQGAACPDMERIRAGLANMEEAEADEGAAPNER